MPYSSSPDLCLRRLLSAVACLTLTAVQQSLADNLPPARQTDAKQASGASAAEEAHKVAANIIAAYGGLSKLKDLKELPYKSHGTHSVISAVSGAANALACSIVGHDDKLRLETTVIGQQMTLGYDGKNSWTQFGDWVSPCTATTVKQIADEMRHGLNLLASLPDTSRKLIYRGKKMAAGKSCDVIEVYADDGKPTTFYADAVSHLILRSEFMGVDHEQGVPAIQAVDYLDYRLLSGTSCPFKTVEYTGGKKTSESVLDKFEFLPDLDDKVFAMPPESEVARVKRGPVTVPFDFTANEVIVVVHIGSRDYRFIVDTGASQTVIDKAVASSIGHVSKADFSITAGSQAVPLSYMTVPTLTIGDLSLDNVPALVTDLSSFAAALGERPAGLLGANVLRRFLVTLDFGDKKMILADPHQVSIPAQASILKTSPVYGATALVVSGKLDHKCTLNFLVDSGAGFSNLPQSIAKTFFSGPLLPVGQVFGVDGKKVSIASMRFNSLTLGSIDLPDPVFALSPNDQAAAGETGLFTAHSMGILGNPIWSQFRTTIDYRGEQIILEHLPQKARLAATLTQLRQIERNYHTANNSDQAIKSCEEAIRKAHALGDHGCEALGLAAMAGYYAQKATGNSIWSALAGKEFTRAAALAKQASDKQVAAKVLASWAGYYLNSSKCPNDLMIARGLLRESFKEAPSEPDAYACLGTLCLKANNLDLAKQSLDQALLLDPSHWLSLWTEYKLYQSKGDLAAQKKVVAQLQRYFPNAKDTLSVTARNKSAGQPHSNAPATSRQLHGTAAAQK